jgi:3-oxoacyl-[acyl-carrier-protein] synthase-3
MARSAILGVGHYVPTKVVTNDDLAKLMPTTDEWIQQRTGIKERRFIEHDGIGASDLAVPAAKMAVERAGRSLKDVDAILFATLSPDVTFPGSGCLLADKLGLPGVPALDVRNQCSGFLYSLSVADAWVRTGSYKNVLVVGSEVHSTGVELNEARRSSGRARATRGACSRSRSTPTARARRTSGSRPPRRCDRPAGSPTR